MKKLQTKIIEWAISKNLNNPNKQCIKVFEELGEVSKELLSNDKEKLKMELGDLGVTIIILFWQTKNKLSLKDDIKIQADNDFFLQLIGKCLYDADKRILSYLNALCVKHNTTLIECLEMAYNKIAKRKGKTINGTFVKD